ncbi:MAG TPA: CDP-glycerol glycerophosphotransferase family protein [Propionibacteriaceae bacterium]|nr:CDP-glycerol glycerophosphotransferase family protein [Propionibacteriaceae bacterium]
MTLFGRQILPHLGGRTVQAARAAGIRLRNEVAAVGFAERAGGNGLVPNAGIAVFFATGPENFYQFEQWRLPLEHLATQRPVFVIVDRPDTGDLVLGTSSLPVAFARGSASLERLVAERDVRVVLYLNQLEANFRMLRFASPVHIQIGHGESDKDSSISNQHKAYDLVFVGGDAGRDRLGQALRGFDANERTLLVGRPQLDYTYQGAPSWQRDSGMRVWYAPTWAGDRPSIAYGSLASHGVAIIEALLADPSIRVIYRPHPRTRYTTREHRDADKAVRTLLARTGDRHLVDRDGYGWQWDFADACITDVSAVAYDWLATGKPLVITEPALSAYRPISPLLDTLPLLGVAEAGEVLSKIRALQGDSAAGEQLRDLAYHYFGDVSAQQSTKRFEDAIEHAYQIQQSW